MNGIATRSLIIQGSASAMHHLRNNHQNEGVFLLYASHMCLCIGNMYIVPTGLLQLLGMYLIHVGPRTRVIDIFRGVAN